MTSVYKEMSDFEHDTLMELHNMRQLGLFIYFIYLFFFKLLSCFYQGAY